jgi:cobalt-precorrin 5A hydrolase
MKVALISLSSQGARVARQLSTRLPETVTYLHESVKEQLGATKFSSVIDLTRGIFHSYEGLVFIAPCGVVVRAIASSVESKYSDPAVVVVDVAARWAISLLSGHEGGANGLALLAGNILGAEPVITTTTEALKMVTVGIGCRKGTESAPIVDAVKQALDRASVGIEEVRLMASADIKSHEKGLLTASDELGLPIRFISSEEIRSSPRAFGHSEFVQEKVDLPAVAEPAALLSGRRTRLLLPKTIINGVTVAVARESCSWSESDPEER